jgi:hypothetical protein
MPKLNPHVAQRRRASVVIRDQLQRVSGTIFIALDSVCRW